ncbi:MAG TPA: hypothetical protein VG276_19530 [Actinomycetes bacterium]|jgi:hypothetical protein|nr:hypothetical protein [Actinomycetes bacterium]
MTNTAALASPIPITATELSSRDVGQGIFWMLSSSPEWVHRRREYVSFHDSATVSRRVRVELTVPDVTPRLGPLGGRVCLVPLAFLEKREFTNFDVRDEDGRTLPVLTADEAITVGTAALLAAACHALSCELGGLDEGFADRVRDVVAGDWDEAGEHDERDARFPMELRNGQVFWPLLERLASEFPVLVLLPECIGQRRILEFSYDETVDVRDLTVDAEDMQDQWIGPKPKRLLSRLASRLGWAPTRITVPILAAADSKSYHFEARAPDGVEITEAALAVGPDRKSPSHRHDWAPGGTPGVHLHVSHAVRGSKGDALISLRASRRGWLAFAWFSATVIALVLLLGMLWIPKLLSTPDHSGAAAAAFLLVLPGVFATVLVRPGEHAMASLLLLSVRGMLLTAGLIAYVAAALPLSGLPQDRVTLIWGALSVLAVTLAVAITLSYRLPRIQTKRPSRLN